MYHHDTGGCSPSRLISSKQRFKWDKNVAFQINLELILKVKQQWKTCNMLNDLAGKSPALCSLSVAWNATSKIVGHRFRTTALYNRRKKKSVNPKLWCQVKLSFLPKIIHQFLRIPLKLLILTMIWFSPSTQRANDTTILTIFLAEFGHF